MNREHLLARLAEEGAKRLEPQYVQELVSEIQAHLDADIQARMELGISEQEAEDEAVRSLGSPDELVKSTARANPKRCKSPWIDRNTLYAVAAGHLAMLPLMANGASTPFAYPLLEKPMYVAWALAGAWIATACWRARRVQIITVLVLIVPAALVYSSALASSTAASEHPLVSGTPYHRIPLYETSAIALASQARERRIEFEDAFRERLDAFRGGTLSREEALQGPKWSWGTASWRFRAFSSEDEALQAWTAAWQEAQNFERSQNRQAQRRLAELQELRTRTGWKNFLMTLPLGALYTLGVSIYILKLCIVAWLARVLTEFGKWLRKRRRFA